MSRKGCIFVDCRNTTIKTPDKIFVCVPKNSERRRRWFEIAGRSDVPTGRGYYCCEDHFDLETDAANWIYFKMMGKNIVLKDNVLPRKKLCHDLESQLPKSAKKLKAQIQRDGFSEEVLNQLSESPLEDASKHHKTNQRFREEPGTSQESEHERESRSLVSHALKKSEIRINNASSYLRKGRNLNQVQAFPSFRDFKEKLHCGKPTSTKATMTDSIETEEKSTFTYSDEKKLQLSKLYSEHTLFTEFFDIDENAKFYSGLPRTKYSIINYLQFETNLPLTNILIVINKICTNSTFKKIGMDFNLSDNDLNEIFKQSLPFIACKLKDLIVWDEKIKSTHSTPEELDLVSQNVNAIFDCFEVEVSREKTVRNKYPPSKTYKFLISSTPNGYINFISTGFGKEMSDSEIFQKSGYIDVIPCNAVIMSDLGFKSMGSLLQKKNVKHIQPLFWKMKTVSQNDEMKISMIRNSNERLIRTIREFRILHFNTKIDHQLEPLLNYVVVIVCGILNWKESLND